MFSPFISYCILLTPPLPPSFPLSQRGYTIGMMAMTTISGSVLAGVIYYFLRHYPIGWRVCMAMPVVVLAIKVAVLSFLPESPRWLLGDI